MMAYADYDYYIRSYLAGMEPVMTDPEFSFFEKQAETEIDRYTHRRIRSNLAALDDTVRECACEITELLYEADKAARAQMQSGLAGPLVSWSNDGNSGAVDLSQSNFTESGKRAKIREIIYRYLSDTGLLYAGV